MDFARARNGPFIPHQERDIICMMCHLFLKKLGDARLIHAYATHDFDLIFGFMKTEKCKDQKHTHCLGRSQIHS